MIRLGGIVNLQALKEEEKWIQKAIKKPGALHTQLGVPEDEPIPAEKMDAAAEKGGKLGQRARLAQTLKKLKEMGLTQDQQKKVDALSVEMEELSGKQKNLDVDGDGKIEADDLKKLRNQNTDEMVSEAEDHEVSMAQNLLDDIIRNATDLKSKLGEVEKDIPAWIQDHISQSQNFISQANVNYHENDSTPTTQDSLQEVAPEGWEKTIKAMKKNKEIDNPWALANWMKKKGYKPQTENVDKTTDAEEEVKEGKFTRSQGKNSLKNIAKRLDAAAERNRVGTAMVTNPETGQSIMAMSAYNAGPEHPAYNAAKAALKI